MTAAHYKGGHSPGNDLGLHYTALPPIVASCPYSDQLLVTRKFWSPGANRPSQANSRSDRARPAASSSNHARPRAIALISVGSHRERSFCTATPGSTSLISTPRRLNATRAVISIGLSLGFSAVDRTTAPLASELRRILIV